jgi:hypothetical protein
MAALRRGTKHSVELGDEVVVLSRKAAKEAVKAEKQIGKAAKADRKAAEKSAAIAAEAAKINAKRDAKDAKRDAKKRGDDRDDDTDAGEGGPGDPLTGAKIKRYIGVARVVVPVLTPIIYQAVGTARARWDDYRARQLGVAPDELNDFTGRGAALYARIHNISLSVRDLRSRRARSDDAADVRAFADDTESRLSDLEAAVRAAEQMPTARRRRAHDAAGRELDRIEAGVLSRLGLDRGGAGQRAIDSGAQADGG